MLRGFWNTDRLAACLRDQLDGHGACPTDLEVCVECGELECHLPNNWTVRSNEGGSHEADAFLYQAKGTRDQILGRPWIIRATGHSTADPRRGSIFPEFKPCATGQPWSRRRPWRRPWLLDGLLHRPVTSHARQLDAQDTGSPESLGCSRHKSTLARSIAPA